MFRTKTEKKFRTTLLKAPSKCCGTRDAVANWLPVLQKSLEQHSFCQSNVDPCLFARNDCVIATRVDDCLVFCKNDKILNELIDSLQGEFNLTDEGDLESSLGIKITHYGHDVNELT